MAVHFIHSTTAMALLLLLLLLLFTCQFLSPASCSSSTSSSNNNYYCDWCPRHVTASLFPPAAAAAADLNDAGACGYRTMDTELLNGGHIFAAASAEFFRDGAGCGACFQLRCRDRRLCVDDGVKVVVTGSAKEEANRTGFLLAKEALAAMARHGMSDQLATLDSVQVDFRRIPCEYKKNLAVRVEEGSRNPSHLAVRFLYQGGQTDIAAVEIAQVGATPPSWRSMARRRNHQGMWRTSRAPDGPLLLRLVVTAGSGGKWMRTDEAAALPADWRPGAVYDTGLRVTDVALRTCSRSCRAGDDNEELR
uniref:Expansin-like EG45 domain-containing protein n=1 Tax=Arundo donax TaxID=35708 RepID=A0A0A9E634_ARUDO